MNIFTLYNKIQLLENTLIENSILFKNLDNPDRLYRERSHNNPLFKIKYLVKPIDTI